MIYPKIIHGVFLKRPNRFIAHVLVNNVEEVVHVKNTGRCQELLIPGVKVILEDCSHNKNRKTKYSLIAVYKGSKLINMDSQVPNKVIFDALSKGLIEEVQNIKNLKKEKTYKNSRFDIFFEMSDKSSFLEVKGVTLENNGIAMFPDAPTKRGTKHILEMIDALNNGYGAFILFLIQMKGPKVFRPNWNTDPDFSRALLKAKEAGVEILVYDSIVKENSISIGSPVTLDLSK